MYQVDDLVMYGGMGVCRVKEIISRGFGEDEPEQKYYILEPLYQSGTIYAPVDNTKVFMRPVISKDEANEVIDQMPLVDTDIFRSSSVQQLSKHYQAVLDTHKILDLVALTKSINKKEAAALKQNRHLGQIDKKFMKRAENLLFGELAAALSIPFDDVPDYIAERLGEE